MPTTVSDTLIVKAERLAGPCMLCYDIKLVSCLCWQRTRFVSNASDVTAESASSDACYAPAMFAEPLLIRSVIRDNACIMIQIVSDRM